MAFNVVDVETGTLVRFQRKQGLAEFKTPARAMAYAKKRGAKDGKRYKIKAVVADNGAWIEREQRRMNDKTYVPVPFVKENWYKAATGHYNLRDLEYTSLRPYKAIHDIAKHHFPHVSMANKSMLAYTESPEKGARDIQTQIKPGAYLAKYFGSVLSTDDITYFVNRWQTLYADVELKFARTPDEIVYIYQNGPRSCMSGAATDYSTRDKNRDYHHPCEVYGQPDSDLTLAYIKGKAGVSARCLVWEKRKQFGRIYGDSTLIRRELEAIGYRQVSSFDGAKLAKIEIGHGYYLMAYVDGCSAVLDNGDHFLIDNKRKTKKGEVWYYAGPTNGATEQSQSTRVYECIECGDDEVTSDDAYHHDGNTYCRDCFNDLFEYCERYGRYVLKSDGFETVYHDYNREYQRWYQSRWCRAAMEVNGAFLCPRENAWFAGHFAVKQPDGTVISLKADMALKAKAKTETETEQAKPQRPAAPVLTPPQSLTGLWQSYAVPDPVDFPTAIRNRDTSNEG